ncbi:hypothetical protein Mal64_17310 [Pseudobythopirellula maris]|uniref:YetF C-terminal domain-containing protein n=1 Tax=Pseudobythopirellula maris TaxID=2527991 RepID=A0A5C5ZLD7_9BACT|nr:YetF domain-containing protein [Pseudobythopirellula maris]TWT88252.1 hypothetical protein Mal64_17310 [Pseudobythopirellula maris]
MFQEWVLAPPREIGMVLLSTLVTYTGLLIYTRMAGLRSFSKMSASDFAMTVAVGSLFASTISSPSPSLVIGLAALASLYFGQWLLARLRRQSSAFSRAVDNQPMLLMHGSVVHDDLLRRANVTRNDLFGKLREANALNYDQVLAVVFETTGDISVLHSCNEDARIESDILKGVLGADRIPEECLVQ